MIEVIAMGPQRSAEIEVDLWQERLPEGWYGLTAFFKKRIGIPLQTVRDLMKRFSTPEIETRGWMFKDEFVMDTGVVVGVYTGVKRLDICDLAESHSVRRVFLWSPVESRKGGTWHEL